MFSIDTTSNEKYYIILKNGKEFCKISKAANTLEEVKKYFKINLADK